MPSPFSPLLPDSAAPGARAGGVPCSTGATGPEFGTLSHSLGTPTATTRAVPRSGWRRVARLVIPPSPLAFPLSFPPFFPPPSHPPVPQRFSRYRCRRALDLHTVGLISGFNDRPPVVNEGATNSGRSSGALLAQGWRTRARPIAGTREITRPSLFLLPPNACQPPKDFWPLRVANCPCPAPFTSRDRPDPGRARRPRRRQRC